MQYFWPILVALGLWWLTTFVLLRRIALPPATYRRTLVGASLLAAAGIICIGVSLETANVGGAYLAFAGALALWCWLEATYFLGVLTGPRPRACPQHARGWSRFWYGVGASLYHELAVIAVAVVLLLTALSSTNPLAALVFVVLWLMRWSSKMNIFFGVSNLHQEFWPSHLAYLGSYVSQRPRSAFIFLSAVIAVALAAWIVAVTARVPDPAYVATARALALTLLALACVEHLFLMVKLPDQLLWRVPRRTPPEAHRVSVRATLSRTGHLPGQEMRHRP